MKGWIKLHRQISRNKLWLEEPFTKGQAWVDLVLNANHTDGSFFVRGVEIRLKRGQIGWSELTMADRWQWSRTKVRRYLKRLESDTQVIQQKVYRITSVITILNYDKYQGDTTEHTTEHTTDDTQTRMIKNDKELGEPSSQLLDPKGNEDMSGFNKVGEDYLEEDLQIDPDHAPKGKKKEKKVPDEIQQVFDLFDNPAKAIWRMREIEREAAKALYEAYGMETLQRRMDIIKKESVNKDTFFPLITTPATLLDKMPNVENFLKK